jgi:hypothetical protein
MARRHPTVVRCGCGRRAARRRPGSRRGQATGDPTETLWNRVQNQRRCQSHRRPQSLPGHQGLSTGQPGLFSPLATRQQFAVEPACQLASAGAEAARTSCALRDSFPGFRGRTNGGKCCSPDRKIFPDGAEATASGRGQRIRVGSNRTAILAKLAAHVRLYVQSRTAWHEGCNGRANFPGRSAQWRTGSGNPAPLRNPPPGNA